MYGYKKPQKWLIIFGFVVNRPRRFPSARTQKFEYKQNKIK